MSDITLVRMDETAITEADREVVRRVVFGMVEGLGEVNRKRWHRLWWAILRLQPGEMIQIKSAKKRSGPFHRWHMKVEHTVFEAQETFSDFENGFRTWLKIGAGHCDWFPNAEGTLFPVPRSTAYSALEDGDMRDFHDNAMAFLRSEHAAVTLWPHLRRLQAMNMMHAVLSGFDR
jgi:hypothetical protein